jgi:hypothetical protein
MLTFLSPPKRTISISNIVISVSLSIVLTSLYSSCYKSKSKSREIFVNNYNKRRSSSIQLSTEGNERNTLVHQSIYMDETFVNSILTDSKLVAICIRYGFTELIFTTGATNTIWKAKLIGDHYIIYSKPH